MSITSKVGTGVSADSVTSASILDDEIVNADIDSAAAIAFSKMANLTNGRALVSDGSGDVSVATTTSTEIGYVNGVTSAIQTQLDAKQATDTDLTAVAGLSSTGLIARTGSGTASVRTLTAPAAGITVTDGDGVSGNPTLVLANDLAALEAISGTNVVPYRTGSDAWTSYPYSPNGTYVPVLTLNGGAGNTLSVYSTNLGLSDVHNLYVDVDVLFTGDGGAEGAGTGQFYCTLPFQANADEFDFEFPCGTYFNGSTENPLFGNINASGTIIKLWYFSVVGTRTSLQGNDQNNIARGIRLKFKYKKAA